MVVYNVLFWMNNVLRWIIGLSTAAIIECDLKDKYPYFEVGLRCILFLFFKKFCVHIRMKTLRKQGT